MTQYTRKRVKPVEREVGILMQAGFTKSLAQKLLDLAVGLGGNSRLESLQAESRTVLAGLAQKKKLKDVTKIYKRRKDAEMVLQAKEHQAVQPTPARLKEVL